MKKLLLILAISIFQLCMLDSFAQAPNAIPYQGVARNAAGNILASQPIGLRISIHDLTSTGTVLFSETHNTSTNALGLFNVNIGLGTAITGTLDAINWNNGARFMQVEMDPAGGTAYINMGTTQVNSSPYALFSGKTNGLFVSNSNTFTGLGSSDAANVGNFNTATGYEALGQNAGGFSNTAIGGQALVHSQTGDQNTAVGYGVLKNNVSGSQNTAIGGRYTGQTNVDGSYNTFVGTGADASAPNLNNATAIGGLASVGASNSLVLGSINGVNGATADTKVGIGTTTPAAKLDLAGNIKIADGTQGANKMLVSDAAGLASWQKLNMGTLTGTPFTPDLSCMAVAANTNTAGSSYSVAVNGSYVYVANEGGSSIQVFDITNPVSPLLATTVNTGNTPHAMTVSGSYLYVVNSQSNTMQVIDISSPSSASLVGTIATDANPIAIAVSGSYAYVLNYDAETMKIYNISNPASPSLVSTTFGLNQPAAIAVSGDHVYITKEPGSMEVYNISSPAVPAYVATVPAGSYPIALAISGSYAYVLDGAVGKISVYNISTSTPAFVTQVSMSGLGKAISISGSFAFVASRASNTFKAFNLSNPALPVLAGTVNTGAGMPSSVAVSGNYAFIVNNDASLLQTINLPCATGININSLTGNLTVVPNQWKTYDINIANTNGGNVGVGTINPLHKLHVANNGGTGIVHSAQGVEVGTYIDGQGGWLGTNTDHPLHFYTNFGNEQVSLLQNGNVGIGTPTPGTKLEVSGQVKITGGAPGTNKILVSDAAGLASWQAMNTSMLTGTTFAPDFSCMAIAANTNTASASYSVAVSGNYAYVANEGSSSIQVFNISNPVSPTVAATVSTGNQPHALTTSGNYLYVVNSQSNTMQVINISNPASASVVSTIATGTNPIAITVSGNYAYVLNYDAETMTIYNISNPASPSLVSTTFGLNQPAAIAVSGNHVYITKEPGSMEVYNISSPAVPAYVATVPAGSYPIAVAISGSYAYVLDGAVGKISVYNISSPTPAFVTQVSISGLGKAISISGSFAFVASRASNTFRAFNLSNPALPVLAGTINTGSGTPSSVGISGNYAFLVNNDASLLQTINLLCTSGISINGMTGAVTTVPTLPAYWQANGNNLSNTSSGNVGIGTTSPAAKLDVNGEAKINGLTVGRGPGNIGANTAVGIDALHNNTTGDSNMGFGFQAIYSNTTSNHNNGFGSSALYNTTGEKNTGMGGGALIGNTTGSFNSAFGFGANVTSGNLTNATAIGSGAQVSASNSLVLGNNANVGIGISAPTSKLHVVGNIRMVDGTQAAGKVMTSDANGVASWQTISGGLANGSAAGNTPYWDGSSWVTNSDNIYNNGGSVGIGTTSPANKLDVVGNIKATTTITAGGLTTAGIVTNTAAGLLGTTTTIPIANGGTGSSTKNFVDLTTTQTVAGQKTWSNNAIFSGNIGIGTAPSTPLHIANATTDGHILMNGAQVEGRIGSDGVNDFWINNSTLSGLGSKTMSFRMANNVKMMLLANGNVGIGTASAAAITQRLTVSNGTSTGTYTTTGWVHSSDGRLKTNIQPLKSSLEKIMQLNPVSYNWKSNPSKDPQVGFVAQDVQKVFPEVVVVDSEGNYGMAYQNLVAPMVEAMKEQQQQIEAQKKQIDELIKRLEKLEKKQ